MKKSIEDYRNEKISANKLLDELIVLATKLFESRKYKVENKNKAIEEAAHHCLDRIDKNDKIKDAGICYTIMGCYLTQENAKYRRLCSKRCC